MNMLSKNNHSGETVKKHGINLLIVITLLLFLSAFYAIFIWAPVEKSMGIVQKIFYVHVPAAWVSFLAFLVVCVSSILYLRSGKEFWDMLAESSARTGVLFITLVLLTGPLWAKPVWNTYWTWDARLTTSLILWLIYMAYLMIRSYAQDSEKGKRFAAVFGIVGFIDVPIVYLSIRWWRTLHPNYVLTTAEEGGLHPHMLITLLISLSAFTCLYLFFSIMLFQTRKLENDLDRLQTEFFYSRRKQ